MESIIIATGTNEVKSGTRLNPRNITNYPKREGSLDAWVTEDEIIMVLFNISTIILKPNEWVADYSYIRLH